MADNVIVRVGETEWVRGEDGFSPEVTIEDIAHGHRVTITDREHPEGQSIDLLNGYSAYEQAVAGGYTGTEAQFNEELAAFNQKVEDTEQARDEAEFWADGAINANQWAQSARDDAYYFSGQAEKWAVGKNAGQDVPSSDPTYHNNAKYYAQEAGNAVAAVNAAKADALQAVENKSTAEQTAIEQKGEDVLDSIPEDYTELSGDVDDLKSTLNADETQYISSYGRPIFVKAPRVKQTESGFVSTTGVVTANNNYKTTTYDVPEGTKSVEVRSVYVAGGTSDYSVIAAYNASGTFIGAFNNHSSSQTGASVNVSWELPAKASTIKVSWGNHSSSTKYTPVIMRGIFHAEKREMIFNGLPQSNMQIQYYFHVPIEELGGANSFSLNGRFVFPCKVLSYEYYLTTYDAGYTDRTFIIYATGQTAGINENVVELTLNQWDSSKTIRTTAAYAGAVVNFNLEVPPTTTTGNISSTGKDAFRMSGVYPCVSEYCFINDTPVETNYYPHGAYNSYVAKSVNDGYNPMLGGRLCCIGDSLTAVYYKQENESWPYLIAKWNSMAFDNLGQSSCPLAFDQSWHDSGHLCMAEKLAGIAANKFYTHIFVMGGANDYNDSITIGQNTDTEYTTFKGAINYMIDALTDKFPCAKIVFATTYQRTANGADKPYADAMLEVCKLKGIPCLNNYENSGVQMNSSAWMARFGANGTTSNKHLNAAGDLFVAPRIEHALKYGIC